jgi:membrane-bound serine protease (ClpP class)
MRQLSLYFALLLFLPLSLAAQTVVSIKIDGTINPVTSQFIQRAIATARDKKAECLLIELNTPGGLLKSTRVIVSDILSAPVPVVVYIAPEGAHAGSAGVFITMAAHIAVMAPGTNIGAAHPVGMQGGIDSVMNEKATNDAAAFIRTIAQRRNRSGEWAEEAVRKSVSITAQDAVEKKVIDLVSPGIPELLAQIDGKQVTLATRTATLHTKQASVTPLEMSFVEKLLDLLSDPNIAYVLLMLGMYGLLFELYNPGAILPGIVGVICLVLAFYSLHTLPLNYAGLALIIFAVILFLLEIKVVSHGLLAIGGAVSLILGSMMLIRTGSTLDVVRISRTLIVSVTAVTTLFFLFVIGVGLRAQRAKPVTGAEGMIGETGTSLDVLDPLGTVWVHGEAWKARAVAGAIGRNVKIKVVGIHDLQLEVEAINT